MPIIVPLRVITLTTGESKRRSTRTSGTHSQM